MYSYCVLIYQLSSTIVSHNNATDTKTTFTVFGYHLPTSNKYKNIWKTVNLSIQLISSIKLCLIKLDSKRTPYDEQHVEICYKPTTYYKDAKSIV